MNVFDYFFDSNHHLEKDFVLGGEETISFKNLYVNSLKLASYIEEKIGKNKNIILISHNSVFFITTYLAILKSGNICIPLDFSIEQNNLDYITNTTESNTIFIARRLQSKFKIKNFEKIINEDSLIEIIENQKIRKIENVKNTSNVAEIIFTSGSTGVPKGVMISHQNIISNTNSIIEYLKLTNRDIIGIVLPFYYCYGLSLLHTHLKIGGAIVLNNSFMFLGQVINDLKKYRCTGFAGVPSHFQILLKKSNTFKKTNFPDLRYVTQAGGKLHNIFIEEFVNTFPKIDFFVMYGQTEATARLSYLPPYLIKEKLGSIGKGIPGVELKIVDDSSKIVGENEEGELLAKGENIMLGYYKHPEATRKAIQDGWLKTGDLARVDNDGFIYLLGRKKEILKVGGKRVSPKEIEEVILQISQVIDCTVTGIYDNILGEAIKATITIKQVKDVEKLKQIILKKCSENLSSFKIPQFIEFNYKMELKSTGKKRINKNS